MVDQVEDKTTSTGNDASDEANKEEADTRMKEIFEMFDKDGDGTVSFKEVVLKMYELTNDLSQSSQAAVNALLMVDGNTTRSMDYDQFSRFFLGVVAACYGDKTLEQVAETVLSSDNQLTEEEIYAKFEMNANLKTVMVFKEASKYEVDRVDPFQVNRSSRLFDLWDINGDGYIDFHELALSLRKFEQTAKIQTTTDEAMKVLKAFDADGNKRLDRSEFALFLVEFSKTCGSDFDEMVDFMIGTSALKKNTAEDKKFIQCIQQ